MASHPAYVDTEGLKQYAANAGEEVVVVSHTVDAPVGVAFDAWVKLLWVNGPGTTEIAPGVGRGQINHVRFHTEFEIEERIVSAGVPIDDDRVSVPSVLYEVTKPGKIPIAGKLALVRFIPDFSQTTPRTEIAWTMKITAPPAVLKSIGPVMETRVKTGLGWFASAIADLVTESKL